MKKSRGILSLILIAAVMVFLGVTSIHGLNSKGMGAARNINLGLDLEGGGEYHVRGCRRETVRRGYERYSL